MNAGEPIKRRGGGRPPLDRKGDIEERLLDAATRLFLAAGYDGTSCDQVAQDARAGKASIYARYANKTALLVAVVEYNLARLFDGADVEAAADAPGRTRVLAAANTVIERALQPDAVALLRLIVAEAPRLHGALPDAERILSRIGVQRVALAFAGDGRDADMDSASAAATALLDKVLTPALLRALLCADLAALRDGARARIEAAVDTLLAPAP
jgi:AcrR family transcriptional regulator